MRYLIVVSLTMVAFAANSILNRFALADGAIGALPFAAIRLASGAVALTLLVWFQRQHLPLRVAGRPVGALSLSLYMVGFSVAYLGLDAGVGALILFGGVQVTMFAGALLERQEIGAGRWAGAGLALSGLGWLLWPSGAGAPSLVHAGLMALAALGWGIYSLAGRQAGAPLPATAANFVIAAPIALVLWLGSAVLAGNAAPISVAGAGLAVVSGVVTSGLGYALWYAVLPRLPSTVAALVQLSVPVLAAGGGAVLLGEAVSARLLLASGLVLGGIALGVLWPFRR